MDSEIQQTQAPEFKLTPREELAVIVQRLAAHHREAQDVACKIRLELAGELIRRAIHSR